MKTQIFSALAAALDIYSMALFVRILLSWIPSVDYSRFGRFLASICDPFLALFSKIRLLKIGRIDFSPMLAFFSITIASRALHSAAFSGRLSLKGILVSVAAGIFGIADSILLLLLIFLLVRLAFHIARKGNAQMWDEADSVIRKTGLEIYKRISKKRFVQFRLLIILDIAAVVIAKIALAAACRALVSLV